MVPEHARVLLIGIFVDLSRPGGPALAESGREPGVHMAVAVRGHDRAVEMGHDLGLRLALMGPMQMGVERLRNEESGSAAR